MQNQGGAKSNMDNIEKIEKNSKRKNRKTSKIFEYLWTQYHKAGENIFYRYNKRWINLTVREIRDDLDVSLSSINKWLTLLRSEELIEYEFISYLGYGVRRNSHDNKSIYFTPKGRALFAKMFGDLEFEDDNDNNDCGTGLYEEGDENSWETEGDSQTQKNANTIYTTAIYIDNNNNYYKSKKECSFSSCEGLEGVESTNSEAWKRSEHAEWCATKSLTARAWAIIQANIPHFQTVKLTKGMSRYIHAALNKLACKKKIGNGISTDSLLDRFSRFIKEQFRWIEEKGVKLTLHVLLHFKGIGAFLYRIFSGKWFDSNYDSSKTAQDQNLGGLESKKVQTYPPELTPTQNGLKRDYERDENLETKSALGDIINSMSSALKSMTRVDEYSIEQKKAYWKQAGESWDLDNKMEKVISETIAEKPKPKRKPLTTEEIEAKKAKWRALSQSWQEETVSTCSLEQEEQEYLNQQEPTIVEKKEKKSNPFSLSNMLNWSKGTQGTYTAPERKPKSESTFGLANMLNLVRANS